MRIISCKLYLDGLVKLSPAADDRSSIRNFTKDIEVKESRQNSNRYNSICCHSSRSMGQPIGLWKTG